MYTKTHSHTCTRQHTHKHKLTNTHTRTQHTQDLRKANVLVFANKQDVKGSLSAAEISQHLNLTSIKDHGWHVQACCALTGEG